MKTELRTDITIADICRGFEYDQNEEKGLYGWDRRLVVQPEYQRHYIYGDGKRDKAVVESILKGYPLGLFYFVRISDNEYEVLDGQQRITSFGRFFRHDFSVTIDGTETYIDTLHDRYDLFMNTRLIIYICEGTEEEIKDWFEIVNIAGQALKQQELLNAVYCGPFVSQAKKVFSNPKNSNLQLWEKYLKGDIRRQDYLETALKWASKGDIADYMSLHRNDYNIDGLTNYFDAVIAWVRQVFCFSDKTMLGLDWGTLYEKYHAFSYDSKMITDKAKELLEDDEIKRKAGIYEYILGGCEDEKLLNLRSFSRNDKRTVYMRQTEEAKKIGVSNCPFCVKSTDPHTDRTRLWELDEMEADHIKPWSEGGRTTLDNCQMLCRKHNRMKSNY